MKEGDSYWGLSRSQRPLSFVGKLSCFPWNSWQVLVFLLKIQWCQAVYDSAMKC